MDGNGSLFGTLSGNTRDILGKFTVELPKKHGRGGQSALRFARLRMEKRHNYVRKARCVALLCLLTCRVMATAYGFPWLLFAATGCRVSHAVLHSK